MDTCICMAESLCCPPEIITMLLIGYTAIQNKKVKKKKKNPGLGNLSACSPTQGQVG